MALLAGGAGAAIAQRAANGAVPLVHFHFGSPELAQMVFSDYLRDPEALQEDVEWTRESAEPLAEWWRDEGTLFLQRVADYADLDWPYRDIEVYLVRHWPTISIEYPLVLALGSVRGAGELPVPEDEDARVLLLAHQLTHYLLDDPEFVPAGQRDPAYGHPFMAPGNFDVEAMVNWLTYAALEDLWGRERLEEATEDELWRSYNPNHGYVVDELIERQRLSRLDTLADWLDENPAGSEIFRVRDSYAARTQGDADATAPVERERATGTEYGLDLGATYDGSIFVAYVDEGSPAHRTGVLQGDVVRTIEGRSVGGDVAQAQERMTESWERRREINLSVERSGEEVYLTIEAR